MPGNFTNLTDGEKVNGSSGKTFMAKLSWTRSATSTSTSSRTTTSRRTAAA
jgi:hypothetical protein